MKENNQASIINHDYNIQFYKEQVGEAKDEQSKAKYELAVKGEETKRAEAIKILAFLNTCSADEKVV